MKKEILLKNKTCAKCKIEKPVSDFYFVKTREHWYSYCKECQRLKERKIKEKFFVENGITVGQHKRTKDIKGWFTPMLGSTKIRATRKNVVCDIDINFLVELYNKQKGKCAITSWEMTTISGEGYKDSNISIDRIDSTRGYIKDNIRLTCRGANAFKGTWNDNQLVELCIAILNNRGYKIKNQKESKKIKGIL